MCASLRAYATVGAVLVGAGVVAATAPSPPQPDIQVRADAVRLTGVDTADSPLGDGTAFLLGPSGLPLYSQSQVDAIDTLYLQPRDYTGTPEALFTPEGRYPATGVKSLPLDTSVAQGRTILDNTVEQQIAGGHVDAANPVVVFAWSQSSEISGFTMSDLASQGVPSDDVHFVLIGNISNPDGGVLPRFDLPADTSPSFPPLGITFSGGTPDDLFPADIYTKEYDGFSDFPKYTIDLLSDLNALIGIASQHTSYLSLTPAEIQDAIKLPTTAADTLTNYYIIPTESLPLLAPLEKIPVIGQPLYDLLEPDMRILVNLGYGSITDGWDQGPANVSTPIGLFPTNLNWADVFTALGNGLQQGINDFTEDLQNLDFQDPASLLQSVQSFLGGSAGDAASPTSLLSSITDFTQTFSNDYATLLPIADTITTLLINLPAYDANIFINQLEDGNILDAVGLPIAADTALVPFAIFNAAEAVIGGFD